MKRAGDLKLLIWMLAVAVWSGTAWSVEVPGCGELEQEFGPWDYTNPVHATERLPKVEEHHFTTDVEVLIKGVKGPIWGDLDYTLRAFPNHHRALYAAVRYWLLPDTPRQGTYHYTTDCYLKRAVAFKPGDGTVYMIYGIFLHRQGKLPDALEKYRRAIKLMPNSAEAHYNLGLLHADMREYKDAKKHAKRAYALGYPLSGLKDRLRSVGAWN